MWPVASVMLVCKWAIIMPFIISGGTIHFHSKVTNFFISQQFWRPNWWLQGFLNLLRGVLILSCFYKYNISSYWGLLDIINLKIYIAFLPRYCSSSVLVFHYVYIYIVQMRKHTYLTKGTPLCTCLSLSRKQESLPCSNHVCLITSLKKACKRMLQTLFSLVPSRWN